MCANCARPGLAPTSAGRRPPDVPDFRWPASVQQILLPCTGRLQPEHVLKAFESGADVVCAVGCQEDNCHYLEGSKRCARRVEHVRSILQEIGLGGERLLFFTLPGSAAEDMALGDRSGFAADGRDVGSVSEGGPRAGSGHRSRTPDAEGVAAPGPATPGTDALIAAIRERLVATMEVLPPSALRPSPAGEAASTPEGIGSQR